MSKAIPDLLTGKQMQSILFSTTVSTGLEIRDPELVNFTRDFYYLLASVNPVRQTNTRPEEYRRLDAMSRLLVGDETCAAVAFDGHNLLIATNENTHSKDRINIKINFLMKADRYATDQYQFYPVIYISLNEAVPTRVLVDKPVTYYYKKRDDSFTLTSDSPKTIDATLTPAQHLLPNFPDFPVGPHITVQQKIPLSKLIVVDGPAPIGVRYNFIKQDLASKPNQEIEHEGIFTSIPLNGLQRRAEVLVDHLATVSLFALNEDRMSESDLQKYSSVADHTRQRVLMNSLSWEASTWYKDAFHPRGYIDSRKVGIDKFLEVLNDDFSLYKAQYFQDQGKVALVRGWFEQVVLKIHSGNIEAPEYIKQNIPQFIEKAERYFIDLAKLEDFFKDEIKDHSPLAELFLNQGGPSTVKSCIKIIDDLEDGVHAEIRVLDYLLKNELHVDYISTSFLCCAHCKLFMDAHGVKNISGGHAKAYAKWILPTKFIENENFLKAFLGDVLYSQFEALKHSLTIIPFNNQQTTKSELALKIVQGIASLNPLSLNVLGVTQLWSDKPLSADESDDEGVDNGALPPALAPPLVHNEEVVHLGNDEI